MNTSLAGLNTKLDLAFYEAEKHRPHSDGYCDKCGFAHCEVGHVLAIAKEGADSALQDAIAQVKKLGSGHKGYVWQKTVLAILEGQ